MKHIKTLVACVAVVALVIFTAIFVINAYNTGKIGHKDEKLAAEFCEDIQGIWKNTSSGSIVSKVTKVKFDADGKFSLIILGQSSNGVFKDEYDLDTQKHTMTVTGNIYGGINVERSFDAVLSEDKNTLELKDTKGKFEFVLTRTDETELKTEKTTQRDVPKSTKQNDAEVTAASGDVSSYARMILGKWESKLSSVSGYEFIDGSTVKISLGGVYSDGTYSLVMNESGLCELKINYISVVGVNMSNTYIVELTQNELKLKQKNAESVAITYVRAE